METKEIKLTDVCDFQGGTQPPKEEWINEPRTGYVRMLQIRDFTQSKAEHVAYVKDTKKLNKCKTDDILIGRYGASVGKILTGHDGAYNVAIIKTIPDETKLLKKYLYYVLTGHAFQNFIKSIGARAAQAGFNKDDLTYFKLHLPSLENQERIASILSKTEGLTKQRRGSFVLLNDLLKYTFQAMFGDPVKNEKGWRISSLKEFSRIRIGPFGSLLHMEDYVQGGIPLVNPSHIKDGKIQIDLDLTISKDKMKELSSYVMLEGDIVLARRGEIGRCAVVTKKENGYLCGTGSIFIRPANELNPFYLCSVLSSSSIKRVLENSAKGITMKNLNSGIVEDLKIPIPPFERQNQFAEFTDNIEKLKIEYHSSLTELENLFGSLGQKAFRGHLNLEKVQSTIIVEGRTEEKVIEKITKELEDFHKNIPHSGASDEIDNTLRQLDAELRLRGEVKFWDEYVKYRIIKQKFSTAFTFDEFWKEFIKVPFDEPQSYDKIKELIFSLLKTDKPFLTQRFNESKKQIELLINETVTA